MKRDWNIIKKILTDLEADVDINDIINDDEIIREHYQLLTDDKYILSDSKSDFHIARLTMKGHDLLQYLSCFNNNKFELLNVAKTEDMIKTYFYTGITKLF